MVNCDSNKRPSPVICLPCTQTTPTAPILDLTVDRPSPNSVVDLTEKMRSPVPRSTQDTDDHTSHAASSHASSSESVTKELFYLVKVVDPTKRANTKFINYVCQRNSTHAMT